MRLLLIEDSARLCELLAERIHEAGWRLDSVASVDRARHALQAITYDLILVDLGLPDGNGQDLIIATRRSGSSTPILVITARGAIADRVAALDAGADDYLVKPFNHIELLARCRALLRRAGVRTPEVIEVGRLAFDPPSGLVTAGGAVVPISPRERSLLELLIRDAGRVVPKERLEVALSELGDEISTNAIELAISRLRRRLDGVDTGIVIETVRGAGYLLREVAHHG